ncbi:MAG TPA: hypothetical protein VMY98_07135 [Anaerolineae bacterium]|nr:hypothetical protein [Anaerolineae bacterium]
MLKLSDHQVETLVVTVVALLVVIVIIAAVSLPAYFACRNMGRMLDLPCHYNWYGCWLRYNERWWPAQDLRFFILDR